MKKLFIFAFAALGMLACSEGGKNAPDPEKKDGALSGKFSVSASTQVQFSQGNLQYTKSTNTWSFMEHQWSTVETENQSVGVNYANQDIVSLFGWGTGNNPTNTSNSYSDYATFSDWGNNMGEGWYTLSTAEWKYLFHGRTKADERCGLGSVNGVNGTILLPDDWTTAPAGLTFTSVKDMNLPWSEVTGYCYWSNTKFDNFSQNTYTAEQWSAMESQGAVFLPVAGYRDGTDVLYVEGLYWSSSPYDESYAYIVIFNSICLGPQNPYSRYCGLSVRLVRIFK